MADRTVRFVLPAFNESASIGDLIVRIAAVCESAGYRYSVLVVDDGSADDTGAIAAAQGETLPVDVVRNEPNRGLGYTIRRGLREESARADAEDVIVTLDADLTQDPGYVPSMLAALDEGADVVIASRYRAGSGIEGLSAFRRLLSFGASGAIALLRPISGVRDYSCGFRAYRTRIVQEAFARWGDDFIQESGFGCMVEVAQRLRGYARFAEVPFVLRYDAKRKDSEIKILPTIYAYGRVLRRVRTTRASGSRR
jgi:dolichol-phosphate mannosyltransferase